MSTYRELLLKQATDVGLEFASNVKTEKLENLLKEAGEELPENPDAKPPEASTESKSLSGATKNERQVVAAARKKAMAKRIVTLTNKDSRESDKVTTAYLSVQNAFFGISRIVPLDTPVELEQCLVDVARSTNITLHKAEVKNGKNTGNHVAVSVKKYAISYNDQK